MAAEQTGRIGVNVQNELGKGWSEGWAWHMLDSCRAKSYAAGSCCWLHLHHLLVCEWKPELCRGVMPCVPDVIHLICQNCAFMYSIQRYQFIHKSWYKSIHTLYILEHACSYWVHTCTNSCHIGMYLNISSNPVLLCAGHHCWCPSLSLLHWWSSPRRPVGGLLAF